MPQFFKDTQYRQPEDPRKGLFQYTFGTDKTAFEYWSQMPAVMDNFNTCMTGIRGSRPSWIEWYPVEDCILKSGTSTNASDVLLVDIAGGRGHDVQAFGRKFSKYSGRLVLQDLPDVIGDIKSLDERIERVEYDFFTPQPIYGQYTILLFSLVTTDCIKVRAFISSISSCMTGLMISVSGFFLAPQRL